MKPIRFLTVALILLGMVATLSAATPAGTPITNQASGTYKDAAGTALDPVTSNIVTTIVAQVAGASFGVDMPFTMSAMSSHMYSVDFQNSGNGDDTYNFGYTIDEDGGDYTVAIYADNGDGSYVAEDDALISSYPYTSGTVTMTNSIRLFVKITDVMVGGSPENDAPVITLTGTSNYVETPTDLVVSDVILLNTVIKKASINGTTVIVGTPTYLPSSPIVYESCFTNNGSEAGNNLVYSTVMPSNTTLDVNSVSLDGGSTYVTVDNTAPYTGLYQYNPTTKVLTVDLGGLAVDATICVRFSAIIDAGVGAGQPIEFPENSPSLTHENPDGDDYPVVYPPEDGFPTEGPDVAQTYGVTLAHFGAADTNMVSEPSTTGDLFYAFTVQNTGNGSDSFTLSGLLENNGQDDDFITTWTFYAEIGTPDGVLSAAELAGTPVTTAGPLAQGSAAVNYVAVALIPGGTDDTLLDGITFSATSTGDPSLTPASDSETASVLCQAPILLGTGGLVKTVSPTGTQPPGTTLTYTITVDNSGTGSATDVVVTDDVPANTTLVTTSLTVDAGGVASHTTTGGAYGNGTVTFTFATLAAETSKEMTFQVTID